MKEKPAHRRRRRRYLVTTIINGEIEEAVMTASERTKLDPNEVDVHIDELRDEIWIKHKSSESATMYRMSKVGGLNGYEREHLADAVFAAGDIVPLKSGPHMIQRIARLREVFQDSKVTEFFLKTTRAPYALAINTDRSWRYVEVLAEPIADVEQGK